LGLVFLKGNDSEKEAATVLLQRLWRRDPSLGLARRSKFTEDVLFRAQVAELLGPRARAGKSTVAIEELQRFAEALVRQVDKPAAQAQQVQMAIRVVAATNAGSSIAFIRSVILENRSGLRHNSIMALASLCDPESTKLLREISSWPALTPMDVGMVGVALTRRFGPGVSVCPDSANH
jgi:hypothetical protein